jgi:RNA polymerase sigma factor (sigma-70 family)
MCEHKKTLPSALPEEGEGAESPEQNSTRTDWRHWTSEFNRHFPGIDYGAKLGKAYVITRDYAGAQDVLQNVCIAMDRLSDEKRHAIESLDAYVTASIHRAALKWIKKHQRNLLEEISEEIEKTHLSTRDQDFVERIEKEDEAQYLLGQIPAHCREVYVYAKRDGHTVQEISDITGIKVSTLKKRLHRAVVCLAKARQKYLSEQHRHRSNSVATHPFPSVKEHRYGKR